MNNLLKSRRLELGLSLKQVGEACGVSGATVSRWESGEIKDIRKSRLPKLAEVLQLDPLRLIGVGVEPVSVNNMVPINVLGRVPAGVPVEAVEDVLDTIYIPEQWTKGGARYIGLKVEGNSMYPKYLEGDTVVARLQSDCESGQDAIIYVNEDYDATIKTVIKEKDGSVTLKPYNPEYMPHNYTEGIQILGVVKELRRSI